MKELSFLMFLIALTAILVSFLSRLFRLNPARQVFFYIPDTARFNIIWGFVFYVAYGLIIAKNVWISGCFAALIVILLFYLVYLYALKSFLSGHYSPVAGILTQIINRKLDAQKILDKKLGEKYSPEKSLKIMGLAQFALERPELLKKRLQMIKNLQSSMTIKHSYLSEIIRNLSASLNIKYLSRRRSSPHR